MTAVISKIKIEQLERLLLPLLISALCLFVLSSCGGNWSAKGRKLVDKGEYVRAIEVYSQELAKNPEKHDAWRDLGFAHYKAENYSEALQALSRASQDDAFTFLCFGLVYEAQELYDSAISSMSDALSLEPDKKTRALLKSRMDDLVRISLQAQISLAISQETTLVVGSIPENTIAVVKFDGSLLSPENAPIAAGLADFTMVDLSKVKQLRLVERLKVELLLRELNLATSPYVDVSLAPRMGRLLGSRNVVTAKLSVSGVSRIRIAGALINTVEASSQITSPAEAELNLKQLLRAQKAFVFDLLVFLGIETSPSERDSIMVEPTESMAAFMAYSRGMEFLSRGMYNQAEQEFQSALLFDKGFSRAQIQVANTRVAISNRQFGAATALDLETSFVATVSSAGNQSGALLTTFITDSDVLEPGDENPSETPINPPDVAAPGTAAVKGNLDGD